MNNSKRGLLVVCLRRAAQRDAIESEYRIKDSWQAECRNDDTRCVQVSQAGGEAA